jgi:glycolate oxidase iron-sulfur subunit
MAWLTTHPPLEADLDACVTCGLCLPFCPTFRLTGDESASPRGRLAAIAAVGSGAAVVDARFEEVTSFCLQCRACETACPSLVPFGGIIEAARAESRAHGFGEGGRLRRLVVGRAIAMRWVLRAATIVAALLQRLHVLARVPVIGGQTRGLRRLPTSGATVTGGSWGDPSGQPIILFTGCVAEAWFPDMHRAAVDLLVAAGYHVDAVEGQTCCGALAAHGGFADEAATLARRNLIALAGTAPIAVDVAGCGAHLKAYGLRGTDGGNIADRTFDITEIVAAAIRDGRLPTLPPTGVTVAVQDPCHLEHGQRIVDAPAIVVAAAGHTVIVADPGGLCCGAAGLYLVDHPETAGELGARKADRIGGTGATIVATANIGCEIQLRRHLPTGTDIRHPVELYAEAIRDLS